MNTMTPTNNFVLHPNAAPVYEFLARIHLQNPGSEPSRPARVLDCGAGGPIPPLALFQQQGFDCRGIDISPVELEKASQFCAHTGIDLDLRQADMRCIPFEDQSFDYVYEHYSMCHLNKRDTAVAVGEMWRVLRPGGLCFLGVISTDTWPRSLFGEHRAPGEFWGEEGGAQNVLHSMFSDQEMDEIVAPWDVLVKRKHVQYMREVAAATSLDEWMGFLPEAEDGSTSEQWKAKYDSRSQAFRYSHLYYQLRRPA